ncbi:nicotinate-nucleotide--dimethylbenzimidazole phosphoribosyltransferase [Cuniculiplasma sp. SKW4]|uniref:nicotinate-nucleotide--dimethylbenzimidazole phosphoribosyltransferase n=1 Tax=Cuniculiplasma sp. SKW4 TaxID=3400171 RepID=UPI003FD3AF96
MITSVNILMAGSTEISKIPGISAAGSTPEMSMITPALDVEILMEGKCISMDIPPMTPDGIPTPSLITRACNEITGIEVFPVNAGMGHKPKTYFYETGLKPSRDPRRETALPEIDRALGAGKHLASIMKGKERIILSETIPGGTTTAFTVVSNFVKEFRSSSSLPNDPHDAKLEIFRTIKDRVGTIKDPMEAMREMGDYMQAIALSFIEHSENREIILAGGTQMGAVYFLARRMGYNLDNVQLYTTDSVIRHRGKELEMIVPKERIKHGSIDFEKSIHIGLRKYAQDNVREGAGMGAAILLALKQENKIDILKRVDDLYSTFL